MADKGPKQNADQAQIEAIIREIDPKVLPGLPKDAKPRVVNLVRQVTLNASLFSGPLPPPEVLQGYENISPGFANRILTMAEQQSTHRQTLEKTTIAKQMAQSATGQWLGFVVALIALGCAVAVTLYGYPWVGGTIGGSTVVSLAGVFVIGKWQQRTDLREKRKAN